MSDSKKGQSAVKQEDIIQAVIIGDSFNSRFAPISHYKPRVLLPLVNRPLLEYTLEFLNNSGIDETFIFSCAHSQQIRQFVSEYKSMSNISMSVSVFSSEMFRSLGDVLRELDGKAIIKSDFILIIGDSIGNLPLKEIRAQHIENRLRDKGCVMTTVFRRAKPNHRIRSLENEFVTAVDSKTNKILHFERVLNHRRLQIPLSKFIDNESVDIRYDLLDTYISICSVGVPPLFADNYDYDTGDDLIIGIINDELMGNSIYAHVVNTGYCARVNNISSYDRVSRDILQRFTYPTVPDMQSNCTYQRHNIYKRNGVQLDVDTIIEENVAIGTGSTFGAKTTISNSTVGSNCRIGNNVQIRDAYVWDNVVIEDNCVLNQCIIADNVHIKTNVVIKDGSVVSYNVILGPNIELKKKRIFYDLNEENETIDTSVVGTEGKGYVFEKNVCADNDSADDQESDIEIWGESDDEEEDKYTTSTVFSDHSSADELDVSEEVDELEVFYDEVYDSLQRGIEERVKCENLILEINSSKHAYNIPMTDLNVMVMRAILQLPVSAVTSSLSNSDYYKKLLPVLRHLLPLIQNYIKSKESQNDCMTAIEEYCLQNSDRMTPKVCVGVVKYLYDSDVINEDVILQWHHKLLEFGTEEQTQLAQHIQGFIDWLIEAEEESSSED